MKIGIIGSRGIPNRYGGFEALAEHLSVGLVQRGHEVMVYNSSLHPVNEETYKGVTRVMINDPEDRLGTFGQFVYDARSILHSRKQKFDAILQLGYTSSSIFWWMMPKARIVTNMDGLEWKRTKYSPMVQRFLRFAEKLAARHSHLLVADNPAIEEYLHENHKNQVVFIPYGAVPFQNPNPDACDAFYLGPFQYSLVIARLEPENHVETIIKAYRKSRQTGPLVIVGNTETKFGKYLVETYKSEKVRFVGAQYEAELLDNLRYHSRFYFHGHSVGGTNPSLLEAMACRCNIMAHDNPFNRAVLGDNAAYFNSVKTLKNHLDTPPEDSLVEAWKKNNLSEIRNRYNWKTIVEQYQIALEQIVR